MCSRRHIRRITHFNFIYDTFYVYNITNDSILSQAHYIYCILSCFRVLSYYCVICVVLYIAQRYITLRRLRSIHNTYIYILRSIRTQNFPQKYYFPKKGLKIFLKFFFKWCFFISVFVFLLSVKHLLTIYITACIHPLNLVMFFLLYLKILGHLIVQKESLF